MHTQLFKSLQSKVDLFANDAEAIKKYFIPKKIRKRQFLLNAGDVCQQIAFVEKGLLRSFVIDDRDHEHVMQFSAEGWWASDMKSFLSGEGSDFNIEALEDSELLLLNKQSQEEMMRQFPGIDKYFRILMQNHIIALQRRIISSLSHSAEEKYRQLMDTCPDIINRASQQHIASFLGITPETLSRIRKQVAQK